VALLKAANHRRRDRAATPRRCAAAEIVVSGLLIELLQERQPDRWYSGGEGDPFALEQLGDASGVEVRSRQDLITAEEGAAEGKPHALT